MIKSIIALNGQTVFDLCLQIGYPIESIYKLIQDSNIDNINETNLIGKEIYYDTDLVTNFGFNEVISTGDYINPLDLSITENYILRQDGEPLMRQDGNNFLRQ